MLEAQRIRRQVEARLAESARLRLVARGFLDFDGVDPETGQVAYRITEAGRVLVESVLPHRRRARVLRLPDDVDR
ncbi:MAG: hypothetical protein ACRDT6_01985 [Micromonosporaceae bacterium]